MKRNLTIDIIKSDLMMESSKSSIFIAIFAIILIGGLITTLFFIKWHPWMLAVVVLCSLLILGFLKMNSNEKKFKNAVNNEEFCIKEECCVKKEMEKGEKEGRSDYFLYFGNKYPIVVSKKMYNTTTEGDMFYVVYMNGNPDPILHYNQNEWVK